MRTSPDTLEAAAGDAGLRGARVFTVPAGRPFLEAVAGAILKGDLPAEGGRAPSPLDLPDITLLLPTRRATRAMHEAFFSAGGGRAMTLPRVRPISAGEEDLTLLAGLAGAETLGPDDIDLPPAVSEIERRLVLTMLVGAWSKMQQASEAHPAGDLAPLSGAAGDTPSKAANLAADLCRLMDMVETEGVDFSGLEQLGPDEFSEHWQHTLDFLKIVTSAWPAHLSEKAVLSPAERRNRAILAEAARLATAPPSGPVIVAGVTGSIPATVALMRSVARLPQGALVLPGLDTHLDEEGWQAVGSHPEHPQFGLKKLLDALGLRRKDVRALAGTTPKPAQAGRAELIAEAMRPSATTGRWHEYIATADRKSARTVLDGVSVRLRRRLGFKKAVTA